MEKLEIIQTDQWFLYTAKITATAILYEKSMKQVVAGEHESVKEDIVRLERLKENLLSMYNDTKIKNFFTNEVLSSALAECDKFLRPSYEQLRTSQFTRTGPNGLNVYLCAEVIWFLETNKGNSALLADFDDAWFERKILEAYLLNEGLEGTYQTNAINKTLEKPTQRLNKFKEVLLHTIERSCYIHCAKTIRKRIDNSERPKINNNTTIATIDAYYNQILEFKA